MALVDDGASNAARGQLYYAYLNSAVPARTLATVLRQACEHARMRFEALETSTQLEELTTIGIRLSGERNLDALMELILTRSAAYFSWRPPLSSYASTHAIRLCQAPAAASRPSIGPRSNRWPGSCRLDCGAMPSGSELARTASDEPPPTFPTREFDNEMCGDLHRIAGPSGGTGC